MFHPWEQLALGGSVTLELVGDDHARHVHQPFEEFAEELLRRLLVPPFLHQDIQQVSLLIDGPPQIVMFALDRQKHFIEVPLIAGAWTSSTELIGILLTELAAPLANRLIGYDSTAFK